MRFSKAKEMARGREVGKDGDGSEGEEMTRKRSR